MQFFGTTFMGGDFAAMPTPTHLENMNYVELKNGKYSSFYITKDVTSAIEPDVSDWNWDTVMEADFSTETTNAGNLDWTVETVNYLVVKRKIKGTFKWVTIDVRYIETDDDFNFSGVDKYNQSSTVYEYAIIPYLNNNPGVYIVNEVESNFDGICIIEKDKTYKTFLSDCYCDTTRNITGNYNAIRDSQYPVFFDSGNANFDTGSCTGKFYDLTEDCQLVMEDNGYLYKKELMDFLADRKPKILKHTDGRIWLIQILQNPTDSADGRYNYRNISFNWVQIGEADNNEHLYNAGLTDIEEKWW